MLNKHVEAAFNEQIRHELESAMLYYQMAAWFHSQNLDGMAAWMLAQKDEELAHAHKLFGQVALRGGFPRIPATAEPKQEWKSALEVFQEAYKHEMFITGSINALLELARKENDHASVEFLQWFVKEQVEEEASVDTVVRKLERIGPSGSGLVMMDKELGKRKSA